MTSIVFEEPNRQYSLQNGCTETELKSGINAVEMALVADLKDPRCPISVVVLSELKNRNTHLTWVRVRVGKSNIRVIVELHPEYARIIAILPRAFAYDDLEELWRKFATKIV